MLDALQYTGNVVFIARNIQNPHMSAVKGGENLTSNVVTSSQSLVSSMRILSVHFYEDDIRAQPEFLTLINNLGLGAWDWRCTEQHCTILQY